MYQFSLSSFLDLLNSIACLYLTVRLRRGYLKSNNESVRLFSMFYMLFSVFFFFLGIAFFFPSQPELIQIFFSAAHLFLYFAMSVFLFFFLGLIGQSRFAYPASILIAVFGMLIFGISIFENALARLFIGQIGGWRVISWSHGGSEWIRLLIGLGGAFLAISSGAYVYLSGRHDLNSGTTRRKALFISTGLIILGLAAFFAFILSIFSFYSFSIVILAELTTITGLFFIYKALHLEYN